MKRKMATVSLAILVTMSLSVLPFSRLMAQEPGEQTDVSHPTVSSELQYYALQNGQTGMSMAVTQWNSTTIEDYALSLSMGVVPSDEFANHMRQKALWLCQQ